jgi:hypothetical protein
LSSIAQAQGIRVVGRLVSQPWLQQFEAGESLAPEVRYGALWHPGDLNPSEVGF